MIYYANISQFYETTKFILKIIKFGLYLFKYYICTMIEIFTDGSCFPNKINLPNKGGYAFCVVSSGVLIDQFSKFEENTSNNRMELKALIEAIKFAIINKIEDKVIIHSDSELSVKTFNIWMHNWIDTSWKNGKVKNLDLVKELYDLYIKCPKIKVFWIKAHSKNKWNNYVDKLCSVI